MLTRDLVPGASMPGPSMPDAAMTDGPTADDSTGDVLGIVSADDLPLGPLATVVLHTAPALADVIAAAQRTAGIDRASDPVASWRARSRWSAIIPTVSVRAGNTASWREVDDPTLLAVSHGAAFDIRASWRLDELLYDPNELRFAGFELATRRERRKVATITAHVYFAWVRAASRAADAAADPRIVLRAAELAAQLDALTDGWFSEKRTTRNR